VRSKVLIFMLISLFFAGCAKSVKHDVSPVQKEPKPIQIPETTVPPPETKYDYDQIDLRITDLMQLVEVTGPYNSYNPKFSFDEMYIAVEVNLETVNKIYIYRLYSVDSKGNFVLKPQKLQEVYLEESRGEGIIEEFFEASFSESFNYEFSWFPQGTSFLFTSNAGMGEYNIFVGAVDQKDRMLGSIRQTIRPKQFGKYFMMTEELKKDGQAKVSPDGTKIVFASGRSGNGDLYLLSLLSGELQRLTSSEDTDFFPQWSPDSNNIVYTTGGKHSHDIHIIRDAGSGQQRDEVLVRWFFDDVLPTFSPDGEKISFYTTYNQERDPFNTKRWGLMIIPSDGSAPEAGKELIQYFHLPDVVKDNTQGTAWFPDSRHIIYAKNIDSDYNPIYIYNTKTLEEFPVESGTNINHDITVSPHGLISFRAQVLGWDRIFIAVTTYFQEYIKEKRSKFVS
jgi:Tol biopolymer transport system component